MNVNQVINSINKKYGMNAIRKADDLEECLFRVPTGSISLDIALGGGVAGGRMTLVTGMLSSFKSSLVYHILANAQKMNKKQVLWDKYSTDKSKVYKEILCPISDPDGVPLSVAIIQSEAHSYTNEWAEQNGIDTSNLFICYPESMEEGLNIAIQLQKQGVDIILHDSYAAYKPEKILDVESDETYQMGIKPKLFDDYHGRYQALNNKADREGRLPCTIIAINQLREKIGCFNYNAKLLLEDGSFEKIGDIVENKKKVKVMSYNNDSNSFEAKQITNWFNNGESSDFIKLKVRGFNYSNTLTCTTNHNILTPLGYQSAGNLSVGDEVIYSVDSVLLDDIQEQFLIGSLLGDGSIRKQALNSYGFRMCHSKEQDEYLKIKSKFLEGHIYNHKQGGLSFESKKMYVLKDYYDKWYVGSRNTNVPKDIKLTPLSLALWYLDDGNVCDNKKLSVELSVNNFNEESKEYLVKILYRDFGIESKVNTRGTAISIGRDNTRELMKVIKDYFPHCLSYKFTLGSEICSDTKLIEAVNSTTKITGYLPFKAKVTNIDIVDKVMDKYDIEVEKNHNYIIGNVLVHNSYGNPEYYPGGRSIGYTISTEIRLRKGDIITLGTGEDKYAVGQVIKFKIEKNKTYKPFGTGEFDIYFDDGGIVPKGSIDVAKDLIKEAICYGIIERKGAWFYYDNNQIAQGKDNAIELIRNDEELFGEIKNKVLAIAFKPDEEEEEVISDKKFKV